MPVPVRAVLAVLVIASSSNDTLAREPSARRPRHEMDTSSGLPGIVEPARQVVLASPFSGVVSRIAVREGQRVRQGDVIAVMDDQVAAASVAVAETAARRTARIDQARSQLELARRYLARLLETKDIASQHAMDQARAAVTAAEAQLKLAQEQQREAAATLKLQQARLATHTIRAPFDGQVVRVAAHAGATLAQADPIVTLVNLDRLRADLYLPLNRYGTLRAGDICVLEPGPPVRHPIKATVVAVEPRIDAATQTFRCVIEIDNREQKLPSGFAVRLRDAPTTAKYVTTSPDLQPLEQGNTK